MQKRPKEQRQDMPETGTLAGAAALAGANDARFLGVGPVGLSKGRFLGEPVTEITGLQVLKRGLARGLVLGENCLLIEAFTVELTRRGRAAERRATSLARRDPSTIPASAPLRPSSIAALVYPPSMVNTAGPVLPWIVRSEASRRR